MWNPDDDGITHINCYSKGKTALGRFLSNFAYSPIETEDGHFDSIEGYWYWLSCGDNNLRKMYGWQAKQYGRTHGGKDWLSDDEFKRKIKNAIGYKLVINPDKLEELCNSKLPLAHYYMYGNEIIDVPNAKWILDFINNCRKPLT